DFERLVVALTFDRERERLHLRADLGARLTRAIAADDRASRIAALAVPPRDEAPASVVTREVGTARAAVVGDPLRALDRIDARVDRLPRARRSRCRASAPAGDPRPRPLAE